MADALAGDDRFAPVLSLAGRTVAPRLPNIAVRSGGFGGAEGLVAYLIEHRVQALVVATHPFAAQMRRNAVAAMRVLPLPVLLIERPPWQAGEGDNWQSVPDMAQAAAALGETPRRVLLTIGRKDLAPFAAAPHHHYVVRSVDAPPAEALPGADIITARGPFTAAADRAMLIAQRIEVIVTKNSGGAATVGKLQAARELGLPVVMVARPAWPDIAGLDAQTAIDAAGAMAWLEKLHVIVSTERGV